MTESPRKDFKRPPEIKITTFKIKPVMPTPWTRFRENPWWWWKMRFLRRDMKTIERSRTPLEREIAAGFEKTLEDEIMYGTGGSPRPHAVER